MHAFTVNSHGLRDLEQTTNCLHAAWLCKIAGFTHSKWQRICVPAHTQHRSRPPDQSPSPFASPALGLQSPQLSFHLYSNTPISACVSRLRRRRSVRFGAKPLTPTPADVPRQNVSPPNPQRIQTHRLTYYVKCPNQADITAWRR